jgi:NADH-quinone oxidoreductase subunit M
LFPVASYYFTPLVTVLCIIGIIYSSFAALVQIDMKLIIAYSSIGHMSSSTIGIFSNDFIGIQAGYFSLISHGLISSALFLLIGV